MNLRDMYADFLVHWWTDGGLINNQTISSVGVKPGYGRVDTKGHIRKMWVVTNIPHTFNLNMLEAIKILLFKAYPEINTIITKHCQPCTVPIHTDNYKRLMSRAHDKYSVQEEIMRQFSRTEQEVGKDIRIGARKFSFRKEKVEKLKMEADSYMYVHKHQSKGGAFTRTTIMIEAISPSTKLMKSYKRDLFKLLKSWNIGYREIRNNTSNVLENFGIAGYNSGKIGTPNILLSDDNLSCMSMSRTKGLIGDKGILLGIDWQTKLPFWIDLFSSSAAQIILVYGRTGSGKTNLCFQAALSLISEKVHCSAIDIKGSEWTMLSKFVPVTEIKIGSANSRFVNTLRLDDINADKSNCLEYFNMAVKGTVQLLATMVNLLPNEGNPRDLEDLLTQATIKVLSSHEVYPNKPETFINSANIKLQELLPVLISLANSEILKGTTKETLSKIVIDRCASFLETSSGVDNMFKNEITVGEILNSPMVVYSFGKNSDSMLDLKDTLRVFMVQYLDTKKQAIRKSQKLHSACFYEELQRCQQFGNLVEYIKHAVTGSRSNNVKMFMLINDLSSLDGGALESVKSSITTKIIGITNDNDRKRLIENYGCRHIEKLIEKVSEDERYSHCFAIDYNTGESKDPQANTKDSTIFKVMLPSDIQESLRTTDLKED